MRLSTSLIKVWQGCPLQAHYREVERLPSLRNSKTAFGICIHEALDLYNRTGDIDLAEKRFRETWEEPELIDAAIDVWSKYNTYGGLREKGIDILHDYHEKGKWSNRKVIATEHRFEVPFGDHILTGIVDLVEQKKSGRGKNQLRIVDYKTTSKQPTKQDLIMDIQFTIYVYASLQPEFWFGNPENDRYPALPNAENLYEAYLRMPRRAIWYHLWGNKEIDAGDRDDGDYMRLYRCITEIAKAVEAEIYVPNISGSTCTFCDYTEQCKVVIPIKEKLDNPDEEIGEGLFR